MDPAELAHRSYSHRSSELSIRRSSLSVERFLSFPFLMSGLHSFSSLFAHPPPWSKLSVFSFLVFFSLTSNPPLLNHPPSSPFISQLLFLSPLSYQWHLVLIFALLFLLSPFPFSFLYIQVKFLFLRPPGSQAHLPAV